MSVDEIPFKLASPERIQEAASTINSIVHELNRGLLGREEMHRMVMAAVLSRGHILFEGLPGTGKTMLIRRLGQALTLKFRRIQFTPDLMPSDILGAHILEEGAQEGRELVFHPGPVFCNILLADEINRASPKTQSALLEAMEERSVTLLGTRRVLPAPFFVLASQNPVELEGTYPLPEAQLDRFLFKLEVEAPPSEVLAEIVSTRRRGEMPPVKRKLESAELAGLFEVMEEIYLPPAVASYIARLTGASHPEAEEAPEKVRSGVSWGASPRAAIGMAESARALALMAGRPSVGFEDVAAVAPAVLAHRLILNHRARLDGITPRQLVEAILELVDPADVRLPNGISVKIS